MKKLTTLTLMAAAALTMGATAAAAQPYGYDRGHDRGYDRGHDGRAWHDERGGWNINARQAQLDRRIDMGLRQGRLTRSEAARLRSEFNQIARLEHRYRRDGLSNWERADLDRRFDQLSARIRYEGRDRDYGYGYGYDYRR